MTTRTENGFSKLQIDKTTTRITNTTTTPTTPPLPVTTLFSFFAAAALCYPSSPHLLQHALPPLLPRHLLRLLILYIVCHCLIPRNHLRPPQFPPSAATALPPHGSIYSSNSSLLTTSVLVLLLVPPVTTLVYPLAAAACSLVL